MAQRYRCTAADKAEVKVLSSDKTTTYTVTMVGSALACPCKGFQYSKKSPPTCRHCIMAADVLKAQYCTWNQDKDGGQPVDTTLRGGLTGEEALRCPKCGGPVAAIDMMPLEEA